MTKGKANSTKNKFTNFLRGNIPLLQQNTVEKINWKLSYSNRTNMYCKCLHSDTTSYKSFHKRRIDIFDSKNSAPNYIIKTRATEEIQ